jgi:phosphoglycolate phosphatase-like HAD superfamily hydrolase
MLARKRLPRKNGGALLLLFDIDGTLLREAAKEHALALRLALHDVHRIGSPEGDGAALPRVSAPGRTDMEIAREIALLCGVDAERFDARRSELMSACLREYVRLVPSDLSGKVIAGMRPLLEELRRAPATILSLVTGNLEGIARVKLDRAGLGSLFASRQGGFGSDSDDRCDLPPIARRRAGAITGGPPYPQGQTIVIGDTARDIACARADDLRCIAVSTGPLGGSGLEGADAVARDAGELRSLLAAAGALGERGEAAEAGSGG